MVKFVILATQRSGSSLLVTSLDSHPRIKCHREIFLPWYKEEIGYPAYQNRNWQRKLRHHFQRKGLIYEYLENIYDESQDADAIGYKFMYSQARRYPEILSWYKENQVRVIHLIRSNLLKTIVSRKVAQARGVYHSKEKLKTIQITLDPEKIKREMTKVTRLTEHYRRLFIDSPYYIETTYEAFVADKEGQTRRLNEFLDTEQFTSLKTHLVKVNPDSLDQVILNYDEVCQSLNGTAFEQYLS